MLIQGLSVFCFRPSEMRSLSLSTLRTLISISLSIVKSSEGWLMRPQLMSVMCNRPSIPPEIHKRTKVGDVLDDTLANLIDFDLFQELALLFFALIFKQLPSRHDNIHARLVDLDNDALELLTDVLGNVSRTANTDLGSRKENRDTDIEEKATLDLAGNLTLDDVRFRCASR